MSLVLENRISAEVIGEYNNYLLSDMSICVLTHRYCMTMTKCFSRNEHDDSEEIHLNARQSISWFLPHTVRIVRFFAFLSLEKNSYVITQCNDSFSFDFSHSKDHNGNKFIHQPCSQIGKKITSIKQGS